MNHSLLHRCFGRRHSAIRTVAGLAIALVASPSDWMSAAGYGAGRTAQAELQISLDFTKFFDENRSDPTTNAPVDGSRILGGRTKQQAARVIRAAADYWETAFENSAASVNWANNGVINQDIEVQWGNTGALATGGTAWGANGVFGDRGGAPTAGLTWDNDGTTNFFVDETPWENSEFRQSAFGSLNFSGVDVPVQRYFYDAEPGTSARNDFDMLTIGIHEIGHTLGIIGSYPLLQQADLDDDADIDITSGPYAGAEVPLDSGRSHFDYVIGDPRNNGFYNPSLMAGGVGINERKLPTASELAVVGQFFGFDQASINFNPVIAVPEPSGLALVGLASTVWLNRRRRRVR